jgi:hypothetical protein
VTDAAGQVYDEIGRTYASTRRADLRTGVWHERNRALLDLDEIDLGYRLLTTRHDGAAG